MFFKIVFVGLALFFSGCGNYSDIKSRPSGNNSVPESLGDVSKVKTDLTFQVIKERILEPHCISCHTNQHSVYDNYEVVKISAFRMLERIESNDPRSRMPKGNPALPGELVSMFREWVEAGAPLDNAELDTPAPPVVSEKIAFEDIKTQILKPYNCVKCHSQYNNYLPVQQKLATIVGFITSDRMPFPQKRGGDVDKVSVALKDVLLTWVSQGAPEFKDSVTAPSRPSIVEPNWISLRDNVIGPKCILCHNSFGPRAPTVMGTYAELRNWFQSSPKLFDFADAEKSHFVGAMLGRVDEENDEFFYDPMPFNSPVDDVTEDISSVSPANIEIIKEWINLKLPYDKEDI